jgi:myo-inositol-1(or 4)-monophosphatase
VKHPRHSRDPAVLLQILSAADNVAREHFERGVQVRNKLDGSLVTDADIAAETVILAGLKQHFPDDDLWSEESGESAATAVPSTYRWVVDPIDGTSAFVEGLAHWGPSLARIDSSGRVLLAATSVSRLHEVWWVYEGRAYFGDTELPPLSGGAPPVLYVPSGLHKRAQLKWAGKARCIGGTAAHMALVARGSAMAVFVGPDWHLWDVAAGLGLIEAVKGVARRLSDGAPLQLLADAGTPFIAGNPDVVEALLEAGALGSKP